MLELIRSLCAARGVSGDEARVRQRIEDALGEACALQTDRLGNLIATKPGQKPAQKIVFFAHMDEVGLLITHITEHGLLRFTPIGIDVRVLCGRRVLIGDGAVPGVVGAKAWHHLEEPERKGELEASMLYIDVGASSRAEAGALVTPGDAAVIDEPFIQFGEDMLLSRALDNRVGCAMLINLLRSDCPWELTGVFTCGEEYSMFGATAAAFSTQPQLAVVLETTTAGDIDNAPPDKTVCALHAGPVVSFVYRLAFETAREQGIPIQTKEGVFGANESRVVARSRDGARTIAVNVPCRYLHSASCAASLTDIENTARLLSVLTDRLAQLTD
jgi:endoglucanase